MKLVSAIASLLIIAAALDATAAEEPLKVAISLDIPPYITKHATGGLEVDVIKAALPGHAIAFQQMPYAQLEKAVSDGVAPVSAGVREQKPGVAYSRNFVTFVNSAVTKRADGISLKSIADLAGHRVFAWENAYRDLGPAFKALFKPGGSARTNYVEVGDQKRQVEKFWAEAGAVIVIDRAIFNEFSTELGHNLAKVEYHNLFAPVTAFRVGFHDPALRDRFNEGLKKMCARGCYAALLKKYAMGSDQSICQPSAK